jgi:hypothetical protein
MGGEITTYFDRPFQVINDESVVEKLRELIDDKEILNIKSELGSVNQLIDSNDKLNDTSLVEKLKDLYK